MKTCSYRWLEPGGTGQCPEETWSGSEEYCIFHDPSPEKDVVLFNHELEEKLEKKDYDFRGYYFPEWVDFFGFIFWENAHFREATFHKSAYFEGADFRENASFRGATFQERADFIGATFQKNASFRGATFQENATFWDATFQENADFWGATFQENADFRGTTFQYVNFNGVIFYKSIVFAPKHIKELNLRNTQFFFRGSITANLKKTKFHQAYLENIAFIDCDWPERIYEEEHMRDEEINLSFKELETIYRYLKQNMQNHGDYDTAGEFYYREMEMRRKGSDSRKERMSLGLYNLLAGYGEKPVRTAISAFATVSLFGILYWVLDCLRYPMENPTLFQQIKSSIYFSFVTFTTLGLGDIHPENDWGRTLICCEAVIGAFLIALFVVVFARKMMR